MAIARSIIPALVALPLLLAGAVAGSASGPDRYLEADLLTVDRLYHRPERPIEATLALRGRSEAPAEGFDLVLLGGEGDILDRVGGVQPGNHDLGRMLPVLLDLDRVARIQVVADGHPIGSPIVVEPLLGPRPLRTVRDTRADGSRYTRVVGFGDELLDPDDESDRRTLEAMRESPDWNPGEPPTRNGFRLYPDRDVALETDFGEIRIQLAPEAAPNTAWNFRQLVGNGFYDGTTFHRIVHFDRTGERFVIQGGDPSGTGNGGPGYEIPFERSDLPHDLGVVSMARADDPDTAGSQFFICLSRAGTARLDGQYCSFGWVVNGGEAIARIADVEIEDVAEGRPSHPPAVGRATLVPAEPLFPGIPRSRSRIATWWTPPQVPSAEPRRSR